MKNQPVSTPSMHPLITIQPGCYQIEIMGNINKLALDKYSHINIVRLYRYAAGN